MASLQSLTINDTGNLTLPSGATATRPTVNSTVTSFTSVGSTTWTAPTGVTQVEVLVVAGGGGGAGYISGGGGAGGVLYESAYVVVPGTVYTVVVGAGGNGGTTFNRGAVGSNSRFASLIAFGGGGGGGGEPSQVGALSGGSGGGGGRAGPFTGPGDYMANYVPALGTPGQGNNGGRGSRSGGSDGYGSGAGGGGAGTAGEDAWQGFGGVGGGGLSFNISGSSVMYAGGGGGGTYNGTGGLGRDGGGTGATGGGTTAGAGAANTGSGGGGGGYPTNNTGGAGGSGVVIVRYSLTANSTNPTSQTRFNTTSNSLETFSTKNIWETQPIGTRISTNGLVSSWDAARYSGTTVFDLSGRGNHATINAGATYDSAYGGHFVLNGTTGNLTLPPGSMPSGAQITIGTWVYGEIFKSSSIIEARSAGGRCINLHLTWSDGTIYWDSGVGGASERINRQATVQEYYGWHYWVVTKNATTGVMEIYKDGILWHKGTGNFASISVATSARWGSYADDTTFHQGRTANIHLYNRQLSADEIRLNYNGQCHRFGRPPVCENPVGIVTNGLRLHLDAGEPTSYPGYGTTWLDMGPYNYQATASNITALNWVEYRGIRCWETNDTNNNNFQIANFPSPQGSGRTYEVWLNSKSFAIGWQSWIDDGSTERILFGTSTNTFAIYPDLNFAAGLVAGNWYQLVYTLSREGTTAPACVGTGYVNGVQVGTGTYASTLAGTGTLYIYGDSGSEVCSAYGTIVRIYDRALSDQEIQQNFLANKDRHGI